MKTHIYVDGFNLYFRALKARRHLRWLDLNKLAETMLIDEHVIDQINYYTARVNDKIDEGAQVHQDVYLRALSTLPNFTAYFGKFMTRAGWSKLAHPPEFKPDAELEGPPWPDVVRTIRSEEKGSDVNLATHLVRDAFQGRFEVAVVITADTDLEQAIRIVRDEVQLPVILLSPTAKAPTVLRNASSAVKIIRAGHLEKSQFPTTIQTSTGRSVHRPSSWE